MDRKFLKDAVRREAKVFSKLDNKRVCISMPFNIRGKSSLHKVKQQVIIKAGSRKEILP